MRTKTRLLSVPLALTVLVCAAAAGAQEEPSAADVSAARALGQEGVKLADAGNCEEAIDRLTRAEKIFHAPSTQARLGECQIKVGKIVAGTETLNRVVRETLAPNAPQAFRDAQERAKALLAEAKPKIAKLKIAVAAPADAKLVVTIDGENLPLANLNMNRPVDPGEHVVEATAPGFLKATGKVTLPEGGIDSLALTMEVDPNAPKAVPQANPDAPAADGAGAPAAATSTKKDRLPAYIAFGVGGAGVLIGGISGLVAVGKKSDLSDACPNNVCPSAASQDVIDSGKSAATVSTVGFVIGGLGIATGVVLLLTNGMGSSSGKPAAGPTVRPLVGAGQAGVAGTF
ncbi:MAG: hypothetical protein JST00_40350 [Deltaproteobacteria bacterium]|nr:hypothetical protein [Deltaproteobacteria bacterium]